MTAAAPPPGPSAPLRPELPGLQLRRPEWVFRASGTSSAFVLLIGAMIAAPAAALGGIHVPNRTQPGYALIYERCIQAMFRSHSTSVDNPRQCAAHALHTGGGQVPGFLVTLGVMILLVVAQYWLGPAWRIRRRRLRPIDPAMLPSVSAELDRLARQALGGHGPQRVRFLLDLLNPGVDGLAFGRAGRRHITLSRGLLSLHQHEPELFRAVVLHELAHVRNHDLDITSVTLALWRSFVVVVLTPGMFAAISGILLGAPPAQGQVPFMSGSASSWLRGAEVLGVAALGWLTRYSVLRARELHADARALTWLDDIDPLRRLFSAYADASGRSARRRARWWSALLSARRRAHPHLRARIAALATSEPLLRQEFAFSLALGACFSLAMDPSTSLTAQVEVGPVYWPWQAVILVLTVVLVIRAVRATRAPGSRWGRPGARLGLALGLPAGVALAPSMETDHAVAPFPAGIQLASLVVLMAAGWLFALWLEWVAEGWGPRLVASGRPERATIPPIVLVSLVVLAAAGPVFRLRSDAVMAYLEHYPAVQNPVWQVLADMQVVLSELFLKAIWLPAAVTLLLVIPLAARARGRKLSGQGAARPPRTPRPVMIVLLPVVAFGGWLFGTYATRAVDPAVLRTAAASPIVGLLALVNGIAAGLGAAVAVRARDGRVAQAALAVVAAVLLGGAVACAVVPAVGALPWSALMSVGGQMIEAGLGAALLVAGIVSGGRLAVRSLVSRAGSGDTRR